MRKDAKDVTPMELGGFFLFRGLTPAQRNEFAPNVSRIRCPRGTLLFTQGDDADGFFGILKGAVKVFRSSESGRESTLHVFRAGDLFGEAALFLGFAFPASARTLENSELWHIPKGPFIGRIETDPDFTKRILGSFALKLSEFTSRIDSLTADTLEVRLIKWLLGEFGKKGPLEEGRPYRLPFPKHGVASFLGATPETLSRALRALGEAGLIEVKGPSVTLLEIERLRSRAGDGG